MIIKKISQFTGKTNTMDLNVAPAQIAEWQAGALIQNVMPLLNVDEREFLITGATP